MSPDKAQVLERGIQSTQVPEELVEPRPDRWSAKNAAAGFAVGVLVGVGFDVVCLLSQNVNKNVFAAPELASYLEAAAAMYYPAIGTAIGGYKPTRQAFLEMCDRMPKVHLI